MSQKDIDRAMRRVIRRHIPKKTEASVIKSEAAAITNKLMAAYGKPRAKRGSIKMGGRRIPTYTSTKLPFYITLRNGRTQRVDINHSAIQRGHPRFSLLEVAEPISAETPKIHLSTEADPDLQNFTRDLKRRKMPIRSYLTHELSHLHDIAEGKKYSLDGVLPYSLKRSERKANRIAGMEFDGFTLKKPKFVIPK
jgi:hypothetical protein